MSVEVTTTKVKKMVETEVEERQVVITVSEEDAAMLHELIGLTYGRPLASLYDELEIAIDYDSISGQYAVKDSKGDEPVLYFFKDGEKL